MENKPAFCSSCGAKLTEGAIFCTACGVKIEQVAPPVAETAPVCVPDNSLAAPKEKVSKFGLILALAAICMTLLASLTGFLMELYHVTYGFSYNVPHMAGILLRKGSMVGSLTGVVVPAIAMVMVLLKKKPTAIIGMAVAALIIVLQILFAATYKGLLVGRVGILRYLPIAPATLMKLFNGETLFVNMHRLHFSSRPAMQLLSLGMDLSFHLKNYLALAACLAALLKKRK